MCDGLMASALSGGDNQDVIRQDVDGLLAHYRAALGIVS
jgi:hypothetical protein